MARTKTRNSRRTKPRLLRLGRGNRYTLAVCTSRVGSKSATKQTWPVCAAALSTLWRQYVHVELIGSLSTACDPFGRQDQIGHYFRDLRGVMPQS